MAWIELTTASNTGKRAFEGTSRVLRTRPTRLICKGNPFLRVGQKSGEPRRSVAGTTENRNEHHGGCARGTSAPKAVYWQVFRARLDAAKGYADARALADYAPPPGAVGRQFQSQRRITRRPWVPHATP
jgi:hypothetical protein